MKICNIIPHRIIGDTPVYPIGTYIWTDGTDIYYSNYSEQKVLIKGTNVWKDKTWIGMDYYGIENFWGGDYVWTDGINIYYGWSKKLNIGTNVWSEISFEAEGELGEEIFRHSPPGDYIWLSNDGECYFSSYDRDPSTYEMTVPLQYKLNKDTRVWSEVQWNGFNIDIGERLYGNHVWKDGGNTYCLNHRNVEDVATSKVLNDGTYNWSNKTWYGLDDTLLYGGDLIWHDGDHTYMTLGMVSYSNNEPILDILSKELNRNTNTWVDKTWYNINEVYYVQGYAIPVLFKPPYLWTDGIDIYHSNGELTLSERKNIYQRKLNRATNSWDEMEWYTVSS